MHMKLAQKEIEVRKAKAAEMVDKKVEVQISRKALSIDEKKHTAVFVMSTENIDRHGDIVDQESMILDYFNTNPAFFFQHRSDDFPLGKWLRVWKEADPENPGKMRHVGEAEFAVDVDPDIERAWKHVVRGDLNMVSIGFIPHRVDYDEVRDAFILLDCELLECSLVGIGSNRQALIKGKEGDVRTIVDKAIEAASELDAFIKANDNNIVIAHLKAREDFSRGIRSLKGVL